MKQRWLSILLIISLLLSLAAPVYATETEIPELAGELALIGEVPAENAPAEETPEAPEETAIADGWETLDPVSGTNPLYSEDDEQDEPAQTAESAVAPILNATAPTLDAAADATYVSVNQAAAQMRDYMVARKDAFTLYINIPDYYDGWVKKYFIPLAYSEDLAVGFQAGDYLAWSWRGYSMHGSHKLNTNYYTFTFTMRYYTTAMQEEQFATQARNVYNNLDLSGLTDFGKYAVIYDYVVSHVAYDTTGLAQQSALIQQYQRKYGDDYDDYINSSWSDCRSYYECHSAFAALVKGKAVCQGFATLFYSLCRMAGLPVRIVASENHGWNIIKLGNYWYNADPTWDDSSKAEQWKTWRYFAKGSTYFATLDSHTRRAEYTSSSFTAAYPMATGNYTQPKYFWDIPSGAWYVSAIDQAYEKGLMSGTSTYAPRFSPDKTTTRAMIVSILWRMAGRKTPNNTHHFTDVPQGQYYTEAVNWAYEQGIVAGVGDNKFDPNGEVTRQDAMVMIYKYHTLYLKKSASGSASSLNSFPDAGQVASYSRTALQWAVGNGLLSGTATSTGNILDPKGHATRAQIAAIFVRYVDKYGKT